MCANLASLVSHRFSSKKQIYKGFLLCYDSRHKWEIWGLFLFPPLQVQSVTWRWTSARRTRVVTEAPAWTRRTGSTVFVLPGFMSLTATLMWTCAATARACMETAEKIPTGTTQPIFIWLTFAYYYSLFFSVLLVSLFVFNLFADLLELPCKPCISASYNLTMTSCEHVARVNVTPSVACVLQVSLWLWAWMDRKELWSGP